MTSNLDVPAAYREFPGGTPSGRIFGTLRRWPLIPSAELYLLQAALTQCVELSGSEAAHELLGLVTEELRLRKAEEPPDTRATVDRATAAPPTRRSAAGRWPSRRSTRSRPRRLRGV